MRAAYIVGSLDSDWSCPTHRTRSGCRIDRRKPMPDPETHQQIPSATIETLARSVHEQASAYGFTRLDHIRLVSALLSLGDREIAARPPAADPRQSPERHPKGHRQAFDALPIETDRLVIEPLDGAAHLEVLDYWLRDAFSRFFLLTSSGRYLNDPARLFGQADQHLALIRTHSGHPLGAAAYLDHDPHHRRADFRILVGDPAARKKGLAGEAAGAWLAYGLRGLALEKIFAQLLEGDVRSARLMERLGFAFEALLPREIRLDGSRCNVERWALHRDTWYKGPGLEAGPADRQSV
jgi:RimJ/RimL family protein N-acetyltransferase